MSIKTPTYEDYKNYDGLHCHRLWVEVGDNWVCPSCKRTKFQILRWTMRFPNSPNKFEDWVAVLHRHHDHVWDYRGPYNGRFRETVLCDQCNSADGIAKRKLGLPENFSFSADEISQFIVSTPHGKHKINFDVAKEIYDQIRI